MATDSILADYIPEDEFAAQCHVTPRTIKRWRALKEGPPATIIGRKIFYRRAAVEAWLLKREKTA